MSNLHFQLVSDRLHLDRDLGFSNTCEHAGTDKVCQPCQMGNPQHPSMDPPEDTRAPTTIIIA